MGKRFDASTPRLKHDGGTWWLRVGSAWQNDKGLITIYLDSYPIPDKEGQVKIMLFEQRDQQPATRPRLVTLREELDDEIPF